MSRRWARARGAPAALVPWLSAVAAAAALSGCETTAERSARLERAALARPASHGAAGLSITRTSTRVKVLAAVLVSDSEATAAVVTVRNASSRALRSVPLQLTVRDAHGGVLYTNTAPGLAPALQSIPYVAARGQATWVDDQISAHGASSVAVRVGEVGPAGGPGPSIALSPARLFEDPASGLGAEGTVTNRSRAEQREVVVYAVARRGTRVVAAGRAVLPSLGAGASARFQAFLAGEPRGATLQVSAATGAPR